MPSRARLLSSDRVLRVLDRDARCFSEDSELGVLFAWTNMDERLGLGEYQISHAGGLQ